LDEAGAIVDRARATNGEGQEVGELYGPPARTVAVQAREGSPVHPAPGESLSAALDRAYLERERSDLLSSIASAARSRLRQETARKQRLLEKMKADLEQHGDAEHWKRLGDLLLANVSTAKREGEKVTVTDYFTDDASDLVIEVDREDSLTQAAEKFFRRYTKARNAAVEIEGRIDKTLEELAELEQRSSELEHAERSGDETLLRQLAGARVKVSKPGPKRAAEPTGTRKFISSDGLEILVGKKATDNDQLTFRTAKSLDLWMHAADYPGSHVVVRNPNRREIPQNTLLEAAQLAAFYSQGKSQPKAAVHYTQKKYVNKPRGAAPGLVSLAKFKTVLVEPIVPASVQKQ
jgi:predicted ribosome quality control (RQC) complex YloA/Tae2 family protein